MPAAAAVLKRCALDEPLQHIKRANWLVCRSNVSRTADQDVRQFVVGGSVAGDVVWVRINVPHLALRLTETLSAGPVNIWEI